MRRRNCSPGSCGAGLWSTSIADKVGVIAALCGRTSIKGAAISMDLKRQQIDAFTVAGLRVRTTNAAEHQAETAKIGPMWGQFFGKELAETIPGKSAHSPIYGVYSAYESDASGEFDVIAGVAVDAPVNDFESVRIEAG